jgi:hypothetical protein
VNTRGMTIQYKEEKKIRDDQLPISSSSEAVPSLFDSTSRSSQGDRRDHLSQSSVDEFSVCFSLVDATKCFARTTIASL